MNEVQYIMNILSICNYEFYEYPEASFVHQQAVEFVKEGCTVHVLVVFPFGKRTNEKRRKKGLGKTTEEGPIILHKCLPNPGIQESQVHVLPPLSPSPSRDTC